MGGRVRSRSGAQSLYYNLRIPMLSLCTTDTRLDRDERSRLARDLREDFGARLLNQLRNASDPDTAKQARTLLIELRALLDGLDLRRFTLRDCVQEWRGSCLEILEPYSIIDLDWCHPTHWRTARLSPMQRCYPGLILREFLRNATTHSAPQRIQIDLRQRAGYLQLSAQHDGLTRPPDQWRASRGLRLAALHAADLHGSLRWSAADPGQLKMDLQFPLPYAQAHAKRTRR